MAFPTTSILDDFNRASLGTNWTQGLLGDSDLAIDSSTAADGSGSGLWCAARWNVATYGADTEAFATILESVSATRALLGRLDVSGGESAPDGYSVEFNNTAFCKAWRLDNGVATKLGSDFTVSGYGVDSQIGIEIVGTTITVYHKASGGSWSVVTTRTDSTYSAAGYIGLELYDNVTRTDDFGGGTVGGAPTLLPRLALLGVG